VLADQEEPMRAKDIHAAVEALVGEPVPSSSVKGALAMNVSGSSGRLVWVERGRYVLAESTAPVGEQHSLTRAASGRSRGV
jgi:hypothetical protein